MHIAPLVQVVDGASQFIGRAEDVQRFHTVALPLGDLGKGSTVQIFEHDVRHCGLKISFECRANARVIERLERLDLSGELIEGRIGDRVLARDPNSDRFLPLDTPSKPGLGVGASGLQTRCQVARR